MDIVSRLKKFMEEEHLASTQFADKCGIPRPTVSQILNGRNKKISDELIGKIHVAYPSLSVMWLMFGEGDMRSASNIELSEAQKGGNSDTFRSQSSEPELFGSDKIDFKPVRENGANSFGDLFGENLKTEVASSTPIEEKIISKITSSNDTYKRITSIVVFYDDSTFQTFNPTNA